MPTRTFACRLLVAVRARMDTPLDLPLLAFANADGWNTWLSEHYTDAGIWLRLAKRAVPDPCLRYADAVEIALRWGWIDGQTYAMDARAFRQRFTPRRPRSLWSRINVDKATALVLAGRMEAPGLREMERAKADGRWDAAYSGARESVVPDDLTAAFLVNPSAGAFFAALDGANRYAVLWRLQTATSAKTRAARLERLVAMLGRGERIHER